MRLIDVTINGQKHFALWCEVTDEIQPYESLEAALDALNRLCHIQGANEAILGALGGF